jgi:hypothetical protein
MTPSLMIRPVLVLLATAGLGACGMVEADPNRFESFANSVAAIPLDGPRTDAPARSSREAGLRPALRVEVMEPHALWDARDGLEGAVERAAPRLVAAAAPAVADAVVQRVSNHIDEAAGRTGLRPALARAPVSVAPRAGPGLVQLGAYSSEASARAAWARLRTGAAAAALDGLTPVYEAVDVGGRTLTRLKVRAPATGAAAVCAAARINDPWCHRAA